MTESIASIPFIVLTSEQSRAVVGAAGMVELRDSDGKHLGYAKPDPVNLPHGWTMEDIRLAKESARSDRPRFSTKEVLEFVQSREAE